MCSGRAAKGSDRVTCGACGRGVSRSTTHRALVDGKVSAVCAKCHRKAEGPQADLFVRSRQGGLFG